MWWAFEAARRLLSQVCRPPYVSRPVAIVTGMSHPAGLPQLSRRTKSPVCKLVKKMLAVDKPGVNSKPPTDARTAARTTASNLMGLARML